MPTPKMPTRRPSYSTRLDRNSHCCCLPPTLPDEESDSQNLVPRTPLEKKRGCTDVCCLLLFILFWCGMLLISATAVATGDPSQIQLGRDWVCPKVEVEFEERPLGAVACRDACVCNVCACMCSQLQDNMSHSILGEVEGVRLWVAVGAFGAQVGGQFGAGACMQRTSKSRPPSKKGVQRW